MQQEQERTANLPAVAPAVARDRRRQDLEGMEGDFGAVLRATGIPVDAFVRVLVNALMKNDVLWEVDRRSLKIAAMQAAEDGLMADGEEGAIVPFKEDGVPKARWLPMIRGIRRKVLASGEIAKWEVRLVRAGEPFRIRYGTDSIIEHEPLLDENAHKRPVIGAYSIVRFKGAGDSYEFEFMTIGEVEQIRAKSRAKHGPWHDPAFYGEMVKKTVARRHAKQLPMSSAVTSIFRRDDDMFDLNARDEPRQRRPRLESTTAMLDHFASDDVDKPTSDEASQAAPRTGTDAAAPAPSAATHADTTPLSSAAPQNFTEYLEHVRATCNAARSAGELRKWFASAEQRAMRNRAGIVGEEKQKLADHVEAHARELERANNG